MAEMRPSMVSLCGANRCGNSISFDAFVDIICCSIRDGIGGVGKAEKEGDERQGRGGPALDNLRGTTCAGRGKVKAIQKFSLARKIVFLLKVTSLLVYPQSTRQCGPL